MRRLSVPLLCSVVSACAVPGMLEDDARQHTSDTAAVAPDIASPLDVAPAPDTAVASPVDTAAPPDLTSADGHGKANYKPFVCKDNEECIGLDACTNALGCVCASSGSVQTFCLRVCDAKTDCFSPPGQTTECNHGLCVPHDQNGLGQTCKTDAECSPCASPGACQCVSGQCETAHVGGDCGRDKDCEGSCQAGPAGCGCRTPPGVCRPRCEAAADCAGGVGGPGVCGGDKLCQ